MFEGKDFVLVLWDLGDCFWTFGEKIAAGLLKLHCNCPEEFFDKVVFL